MGRILRLFDQFERTDHREAHRSEPTFEFWNRSAWPACANIREVLERWFTSYPASHARDLRARFRKRDHNHEAAFFELYLYQVLSCLGLSPEVHPNPEAGKGRPDFAVTGAKGSICYIEANVVFKTRWYSDDPLESEILDVIDAVAESQPTRTVVAITTRGTLRRSHPRNPLQREVREWLDGIDHMGLSSNDIGHYPHLCIRRDDWVAELAAVGLLPSPSRRLIHLGPPKTGASDEGSLLAKTLETKAKRYGTLDRALILAINTNNVFTSDRDELEALIGIHDGIWRIDARARHLGLHGALFFRGLLPNNMHNVAAHLYLNPNIQTDLPDELLTLSNMRQRNGAWHLSEGMTFGDILGLPEDWPGEVTASE